LAPPSAVPLPAAAWLFISGILAVLSPSAFRARSVVPAQAGTSQRLLPAIAASPNVKPASPNVNLAKAGRSDVSTSKNLGTATHGYSAQFSEARQS